MEKRSGSLAGPAARLQLLALLLLVVLPGLSGPYLLHLVTLAMIFGIFALGYDLLFGHTGIISFGHSILFGVPAYVIAMLGSTVWHVINPLLLVGSAVFAGIVLGAVMGWICSLTRGIYLAIVTFALAQIFELLVLSDPGGITLGENGVVGVRPPAGDALPLNLFSGVGLYYLTLALLVAVLIAVTLLVRSQWGQVFHGIRENEARLGSLGYDTRSYKILAFALSGAISAIAGAVMAFHNNIVTPAMVDWQVGAEILLITVLGGAGTRIGPVVGAFVVVLTEALATSLIGGGNWVYVLGGLYILVAMFLPGGIVRRLPGVLKLFQRSGANPAGIPTSPFPRSD
jgi:branched-chain amino acid transport system permease protein